MRVDAAREPALGPGLRRRTLLLGRVHLHLSSGVYTLDAVVTHPHRGALAINNYSEIPSACHVLCTASRSLPLHHLNAGMVFMLSSRLLTAGGFTSRRTTTPLPTLQRQRLQQPPVSSRRICSAVACGGLGPLALVGRRRRWPGDELRRRVGCMWRLLQQAAALQSDGALV